MIHYQQLFQLDEKYIKEKIKTFLEEDIPIDDFTTSGTVSEDSTTTAIIEAQGELVFAGENIIPHFFPEKNFHVDIVARDGDILQNGDLVAKISGNAALLLQRERTLLNLIQRLCGVATQSRKYSEKAKGKIKVLDTRKTTPGLREFEKYAVVVGGGTNHRLNLSTGILIKDNHISAAGGISSALNKIKSLNLNLPIELEVDNYDQINEALEIGVDGFLLDNMSPEEAKIAVEIIRKNPNGKDVFIECSGGIAYETMDGYLDIGIDAISIGALTHSVVAAPLHMEFANE